MKKTITLSISLLLILMLCLTACNTVDAEGLWENATYRRDMTFGNGAKTVTVAVKVEEQSVTFTLKTDEEYLGDALIEHELIAGEEGPYGLYVKQVNGITADYDTDGAYWALIKDGDYCSYGVDSAKLTDGDSYEIVYTK